MKIVFLIAVVVLVQLQEGTASESSDIITQHDEATDKCVTRLNPDKEAIVSQWRKQYFPEHDEKFTEYFLCLWIELGIITEDGEINEGRLEEEVQYQIKQKLGDIPNVDARALAMAKFAGYKCTINKADTAGVTAIRVRNCIRSNVKDLEAQHFL